MISRDVSLYFHIPFCSKKCPYCHFFVLPNEEILKAPFVQALLKEFTLRLPQLQNKRVVSIYFGGGTPTKLKPSDYALLLQTIRNSLEVSFDCEITLEANPEDIDLQLMQEFQTIGINRVSLGVQSLHEDDLKMLKRTHNSSKALHAIEKTHEAGIVNISIDLMFELPNQTLASWQNTLNRIADLPITHLSLYNLTFEPQTLFFKNRRQLLPKLPPEEERLKMLQIAVDSLESIGLSRYEISAFAKPGMHSRHNIGYWTGRPFIGFGPSAFSYWDGARFSNTCQFNRYLSTLQQDLFPVDFEEKLPFPKNLQELLAVQLRLVQGVDLEAFQVRHGPLPHSLDVAISLLIDKGWLMKQATQLTLSASGQLFYDTVASELI